MFAVHLSVLLAPFAMPFRFRCDSTRWPFNYL